MHIDLVGEGIHKFVLTHQNKCPNHRVTIKLCILSQSGFMALSFVALLQFSTELKFYFLCLSLSKALTREVDVCRFECPQKREEHDCASKQGHWNSICSMVNFFLCASITQVCLRLFE